MLIILFKKILKIIKIKGIVIEKNIAFLILKFHSFTCLYVIKYRKNVIRKKLIL